MIAPEALGAVETLIARNAAAVEDLRRLYGFSECEAIHFMRAIEESPVDEPVDSLHVERAA